MGYREEIDFGSGGGWGGIGRRTETFGEGDLSGQKLLKRKKRQFEIFVWKLIFFFGFFQ